MQLAWSLDAEAAPCFNYLPSPDGNWTLDTTSGPWGERPRVVASTQLVCRVTMLPLLCDLVGRSFSFMCGMAPHVPCRRSWQLHAAS